MPKLRGGEHRDSISRIGKNMREKYSGGVKKKNDISNFRRILEMGKEEEGGGRGGGGGGAEDVFFCLKTTIVFGKSAGQL